MTERKSKNAITVAHLELACRHVQEMMAAGVTENLAIRTLELFTDIYAKILMGGSATPHSAKEVKLWSKKAKKVRRENPHASYGSIVRVEHGTPRRALARLVFDLYAKKKLNEKSIKRIVDRNWRLAVITLEEDRHLNKLARSKIFSTPEERWKSAGIIF